MSYLGAQGSYRVVRPADSRRNLVLEPTAGGSAPRFVLAACIGASLPGTVHDPHLEPVDTARGGQRWRLACREGEFDLDVRGVEVLESHPQLFDATLASFSLKSRDRLAVRWLLGLLRLPGGARLLRAWHARRS